MGDDDSLEEEETLRSFGVAHKLMMFCSAVFIGAWNIVFITLNQQALSIKNTIVDKSVITKFLLIETMSSAVSMIFAAIADSFVARYNLMKFTVFFTSVPVIFMASSDPSFEGIISRDLQIIFHLSGVAMMSIYFILIPVENAFAAELVPPNSPLLRRYFFVIHFASYMVQGLFGILVNLPTYMKTEKQKEEVTFYCYALQVILWSGVITGYVVILIIRRGEPRNVSYGISTNITITLYKLVWVNVTNIWERCRNSNYEVQDCFEKVSRRLPSEIMTTTKKMYKLFIFNFCLMYFHGLEMILRTMWYLQDETMSRNSFLYGFSLDVILLICLSVFFPVVEFCVFPLFKKFARVEFEDLRLISASNIMLALAYVLTLFIALLVGQENGNNPGQDKVTLRMYNTQLYPIEWSIKSNETDEVSIHIPPMKSRVYINDVGGVYRSTITSSFYSKYMDLKMKKSQVFTLAASRQTIVRVDSVDKELKKRPKIGVADSHVFVVPMMSSHSPLKLENITVEFKGSDSFLEVGNLHLKNYTHVILNYDKYTVTGVCERNSVTKKITLPNYSLHTLLVFNKLDGDLDLCFEELRSGSIQNRLVAFPQVFLTALAIAIGKVSIQTYTYKRSPSNMLSTAFSFHRFGFACSMISFSLITAEMSLTTLGIIAFLIFFFILIFYFVNIQKDLNFEEEDNEYKRKVAEKLEKQKIQHRIEETDMMRDLM